MKCLFQWRNGDEQIHDVYGRRSQLRRNLIPVDRWDLLDRTAPPIPSFVPDQDIYLEPILKVTFRLLPGTGHELLPVFREER